MDEPWFVDENGFNSSFYEELLDAADDGHFQPEWLLAMMCSESGLNPKAYNKNGGASGLSQLMPQTLHNLGWKAGDADYDASGGIFTKVSPERQILWTARYFGEWQGRFGLKRWESRAHMYLCNFLPSLLGGGLAPDRVLVRIGGECALTKILGQHQIDIIYRANAGLDHGKKGFINGQDLEIAIDHATLCIKPRYDACLASLQRVRDAREPTDPESVPPPPLGHEDESRLISVEDLPVCDPEKPS